MKTIKCQNPQLGFDGQHIMFSVMTWLLATVLLATHPVTTGGYILSGPEFEDNQHSVSVCPNTSVELTWSAPTVIEECKWTIFWPNSTNPGMEIIDNSENCTLIFSSSKEKREVLCNDTDFPARFVRFSRLPMTCDLRIIGMQERVETLWAVEGRAWGTGVIYTSKKTRVWFMKPGDGPRVASGVQYSRKGNHLALQWYQSAVGECINGYILEYAPYDHGVSPRIPSLQGPQIVQRLLELQGQDQRTFKNIEHLHEEKKKIRQGLFDIVLQDLSTDDQRILHVEHIKPRFPTDQTVSALLENVREKWSYSFKLMPIDENENPGPELSFNVPAEVVESTSSSPSTTSATTTSSPTEFCPRLCLTSIDGWCFEASSQIGVVYNPCPEDAYGKATHFCTPKGWLTSLPNLSNCTNPSLDPEKLVADLLHGEANATTTMDQVAEAVNLTKQIYAGDIPNVMQVVETVTSVLQQELQDNSTSISQAFDFANKLNDVWNDLLQSKTAWATLGSNTDKVIKATEFQENVDSSICAIAHHLQPKTNKTIESESIVISMHRTPKLGLTEGDIRFRYAEYGRMVISNEALSSVAEMINVPDISIVFVGYDNLHCILQETVSDDCAAPQSTRIPFIREGSEILNMTTEQPIVDQQYVQVSKIIGAVIGCTDQHFVFSEKIPWPEVEFTLTNLDDYDERLVHDNNLQCVFWNTTSRTWDDGGCITKKISQREVRCVCNHLTNFAVLLDVSGNMQLTEEGSLVNNLFKALTILCSCFSLTALFIAFLIFAFVRGVKSERTPIHTNLCICLFLGQLLLLVGLGVTGTMPLCRTVAVLLHFLFLSAMGWMLMEGILVYVLIKEVFGARKVTGLVPQALCYGTSAVIVVITAAATKGQAYGTERYCWLNSSAVWAFAGPLLVICIANVIILSLAIRTAYSSKKFDRNPKFTHSVKSRPTGSKDSPVTWLKGTISLMSLLGVTWLVGFLFAADVAVEFFGALFIILNASQGFFILLLHVILHPKNRMETLRAISRNWPNVTQWPLISTIFEKYDPRFDKRGTFSTTRTSLPNGNFLVNNTYRRASSMSPPATSSSGVLSEPSGITQTPQEQPGSVRASVWSLGPMSIPEN